MMARRAHSAALALTLAVGAAQGRAAAQPSASDPAAAEALFVEAKRLMAAGRYADACPKLAESQRLDPGVGTMLNLGDCFEKNGQTASAWAAFREAAGAARTSGDARREKTARDRAAAVEPRLSRLVIIVASGGSSVTVKRDHVALGQALWGTPVPVDPGAHAIEATAPGKKAWTTSIDVPASGGEVTIEVPELEDEAAPSAASGPPSAPAAVGGSAPHEEPARALPSQGLRTGGYVALGLGAIGVGLGTFFAVGSHSKRTQANDICPGGVCPESRRDEELELQNDSNSLGRLAVIAFAAGGAAIVAGGVMLLISGSKAPSATAAVMPWVGPGSAGVAGRF